jgi:photosystem II stability/assembly factor-like uncharacterized protein
VIFTPRLFDVYIFRTARDAERELAKRSNDLYGGRLSSERERNVVLISTGPVAGNGEGPSAMWLRGAGALRELAGKAPRALGQPAHLVRSRPPPSTAPGLGPAHLAFLSRRFGFVATTGGGYYQEKVGYVRPSASAALERTRTGGASWHLQTGGWQLVFEQLAFANKRVGVAVANQIHQRDNGPQPPFRPISFVTDDGGKDWRVLHLPPRVAALPLQLPSPRTWYAAGGRLWISTNQGRSWSTRPLPAGSQLTTFVTARIGYTSSLARCGRELWKTTNGGSTWTPLPRTCAPTYSGLNFLTPRLGWSATGVSGYDTEGPVRGPLVIRRTEDGGAHWATLYRSRSRKWLYDTRLHFTTPRDGWAVTQESDQGFHWDALYRTVDGGQSWHSVRYPALPTAFAGTGTAWASNAATGLLWRTRDGGRTWSMRVRPDLVDPDDVLAAGKRRVLVSSSAGTLEGRPAAASWSSARPLAPRALARAQHRRAFVHVVAVPGGMGNRPEITPDGGRTWRRLRMPKALQYDVGDVAFQDLHDGLAASGDASEGDFGELPIMLTSDGGMHWRRVKPPQGEKGSAVIASGTIVIEPPLVGGRSPLFIYVSADSGAHWNRFQVPGSNDWECTVSSPRSAAVWVLCTPFSEARRSMLLTSADGGRQWKRRDMAVALGPTVVGVSAREAWTTTKPYDNPDAPGIAAHAVWHTTDGGSTWHEVWPYLRGWAPVRDSSRFGPNLPPR